MTTPRVKVHLTDVTLRDGLQMESRVLPTAERLKLFSRIRAIGYQRIELTSFSHPKWMPQFAESDAFCAELFKSYQDAGVELMAFVPNARGLERALKFDSSALPWISAFVAVTETFNRKNVNTSVDETLNELRGLTQAAQASGRKMRIYVSTVFGCPYEGKVETADVLRVVKKIAEFTPDELALSDTIGVAIPTQVREIVRESGKLFPLARTALHLHNTYDLAVASALAGLDAGIHRFDGSTGGIGGCPYAKGATGNVALEDLAYALWREGGVQTLNWGGVKEALNEAASLGLGVGSRLQSIWGKGGKIYGIEQ